MEEHTILLSFFITLSFPTDCPIANKLSKRIWAKMADDEIRQAANRMHIYWDVSVPYCDFGDVVRRQNTSLIARFMGPTWDLPGADRTHVGPMLATWILLSGLVNICWSNGLLNGITKPLFQSMTTHCGQVRQISMEYEWKYHDRISRKCT